MNSETISIKEIFLAACKLEPGERPAYLERACQGNRLRIDQIQRLLSAHQVSSHRLDHGLMPEVIKLNFPEPGHQLGPYRLLKEIGEGGFGVVFEAEQIEPFQRRVALKVIKAGMDTRQYLRRFDDERRALALLNHPHIAALYDGGSTEAGRPFFVMELVQGEKITEYCKSTPLSLEDKLALFLRVAEAIEHAHQRGVIHRDIKPSNILVNQVDGKLAVKIIDFGIAKLIGEARPGDPHTLAGDFLGTPMYTSPEQARGQSVDTRSDIYSLGMVLYELVAGSPPHDPQIIQRSSQARALQYVSQSTPKRPSARLSEQAATSGLGIERRWSRGLRHELDAVVMKAIALLPQERYASVGEFIADIQRYLTHQPVLARPQSSSYLLKKFVERHKLLTTLAASTLSVLTVVAVGGVLFSWRLNDLLKRAQSAEQALERSNHNVTIQAQKALLNLARSHVGSDSVGQYFECIDALQASLKLAPVIDNQLDEYRNVAAAAFVLPDLRKRKLFNLPVATWRECAVSSALKLVGYFDIPTQQFCVYDLTAQRVIMRLADGYWYKSRFDYRGPSFSPDSRYLVYSFLKDGQPHLAIWRVGQSEPVLTLGPAAVSVNFRADMQQCAVTDRGGHVRILTVPDWSEVGRITSATVDPYAEWNNQFNLLYVWEKRRVVVYDAVSLVAVSELPSDVPFNWHAWHPDGERIASVTESGELFLWQARTGQRLTTLQTSSANRGNIIQFSRSGRYLALNNWEDYLQILDTQSRTSVLETNSRGSLLSFDQNDLVLMADVQLDHVGAFDFHPASGVSTILDLQGHPFPIANCSVCLDPSGRWLLVPSQQGIAFIDTRIPRTEFELPIPGNRPVGWFAAGNYIITIGADGVLRWPVATTETSVRIGPPRQLLAQEAIGVWSADRTGNVIVGGLNSGCAVLIDQYAQTIQSIDEGDIRAGTVSPSGTWIASGTHGTPSRTRMWRRDGTQLEEQASLHLGTTLQFAHDEQWFTGLDKGIHLWQTGRWDRSVRLSEQVHLGCLTTDSRVMALGMTTNEIDLLEMPSGKSLLKLTSPDASRLLPLSFTHDNTRLIALGRDTGHLISFDLQTIEANLAALGFVKATPWAQVSRSADQSLNGSSTNDPHSGDPNFSYKVDDRQAAGPVHFEFDLGDYANWKQALTPFRSGNQKLAAGEHQIALELFRQAVQLHPGRSEFENNLAWTLALHGESSQARQEAVVHAKLATQNAPFVANNWNTLACACWLSGDYQTSLEAIHRAMAEKHAEPDAYDRLIEVAALHGVGQTAAAESKWHSLTSSAEANQLLRDDAEFAKLYQQAQALLNQPSTAPSHPAQSQPDA